MKKIEHIKNIQLSRLNNDEYTQFLKTTANYIYTIDLTTMNVENSLLDMFKNNINELTSSSRGKKISHNSKNLKELDKKRNELSVFLLSSIRLERKSPILHKKKSAEHLYRVVKNYFGLQVLPKRQKSHAIDSLVLELKKLENFNCIGDLLLSVVVDDLYLANQKYQTLIMDRAEEQIGNKKRTTISIRKETDIIYHNIITYIFAKSVIEPNQYTENFIKLQNKLISDTISSLKQRTALKKEEKQED